MRNYVTSAFEVLGIICLVLAAGLAMAHWSVPGGLAVAGALLIASAALVDLRTPKPTAGN